MNVHQQFIDGYDRLLDHVYAWYESLFPKPIDVRLLEILGGTTFTIGGIRRYNRPLTIVLSRGKLLRSRRFRRMVLDGQGVLASDIKWAIKIQGEEYERDVVLAFDRDERLRSTGWRVAYVSIKDLWQNPELVRRKLMPILSS